MYSAPFQLPFGDDQCLISQDDETHKNEICHTPINKFIINNTAVVSTMIRTVDEGAERLNHAERILLWIAGIDLSSNVTELEYVLVSGAARQAPSASRTATNVYPAL